VFAFREGLEFCSKAIEKHPRKMAAPNPKDKAVAAAKGPVMVKLEKGKTYAWCRCGLSKNEFGFCDGSHTQTNGMFEPLVFTAEESKDQAVCMCKRTSSEFGACDGTHAKLNFSSLPDVEDLIRGKKSSSKKASENYSTGAPDAESTITEIKELARLGLRIGEHGRSDAMGVLRNTLPMWDDIQYVTAQFWKKPLLDDAEVSTRTAIGRAAKKPLVLEIPIFVTDMSFGAISEEAKIALARGAEMAGTGICSGEGGMLPEEQQENSRYFYELASAKFGFEFDLVKKVQAFHFKGGQGAKTGTGGHLPGAKVTGKVARVRKLEEGKDAISPATFKDLVTPEDFKNLADKVREATDGIPIGFKMSAQHIERDIDFCIQASADYIILDGRGGGTGSAPLIFRDHISVPTIPAIARARRHLDRVGAKHVSLIVTGGLRVPSDFAKALALGADAVAVANSALQSIGCVAARMCHTNQCPASIATMDPDRRKNFDIEKGAEQLKNFLEASAHLMKALARACGHSSLSQFNKNDLTTWKKDMHELTGISYAGLSGQ